MEPDVETKLSVNVNAIAFLRNRREAEVPNLLKCAAIALEAGAYGITVHPRPDQRHIKYKDVYDLKTFLNTYYPQAELNIEGFPDNKFMQLVAEIKPHQITLVPDDPNQATSDHGWDVRKDYSFLTKVIAELRNLNSRLSLFCDAGYKDVELLRDLDIDRIEIFTGPYAIDYALGKGENELEKIAQTAAFAQGVGLSLNAGHDLNRDNLLPLLQKVPFISELSIGNALVADAIEYGLGQAVKNFLKIINLAARNL